MKVAFSSFSCRISKSGTTREAVTIETERRDPTEWRFMSLPVLTSSHNPCFNSLIQVQRRNQGSDVSSTRPIIPIKQLHKGLVSPYMKAIKWAKLKHKRQKKTQTFYFLKLPHHPQLTACTFRTCQYAKAEIIPRVTDLCKHWSESITWPSFPVIF